jgi:hypothetical protein
LRPFEDIVLGSVLSTCFHAGFLNVSCFNPEDGGDVSLQNVGWLSTGYIGLYPQKIEYFITSNPAWIYVAQNRVQLLTLVNTVKNLHVP